jgi:ABC-2 type transport system ATP-binding protein
MLQVEGLSKDYKDVRAVNNVSFHVSPGEILGLLGPNGAGKTTVLRSICGLLRPTAGRITVAGHDVETDEVAAKRALGFVPDNPHCYELLTVREHLKFITLAFGVPFDESAVAVLLERLELGEKRDHLVVTLSRGMQQKLAAACAFIHEPPVMLFDEPLTGVDPRGQRELRLMMQEARDRGRAIVVSTHMLDTAENLTDRILILNHGVKVTEGSLSELRTRAHVEGDSSLEDVFLKLTEEQDEAPSLPTA